MAAGRILGNFSPLFVFGSHAFVFVITSFIRARLHPSYAIDPLRIFEAQLKQIFCTGNVTELHPSSSKISKVDCNRPTAEVD
jgi:hypothetical protein